MQAVLSGEKDGPLPSWSRDPATGQEQQGPPVGQAASKMSLKSVLTTVIAGSQYLVHPQVLGTIQETINPGVIIPVTVLESDQLYYNLEGTLRLFDFYDDVFTPEFGNILIEKPGGTSGVSFAQTSSVHGKSVMRLRNDTASSKRDVFAELPPGPYILHGPEVHQAYKIYNDTLDAFAYGVYPERVDSIDGYQVLMPLSSNDTDGSFTPIPVPSRLYSSIPPESAPLRGLRIAVPDAMDLKGVPTTLSSKAWSELHDDFAGSSAAIVQRLVKLGAIIVGKTKSSQFGSGREWTDVAKPHNPREDGKQDPSGGSAGAAAALAGYEWMKASTGFDALGQLFEPAAAQGLFALRTSVGALPLDGSQLSSPKSDSFGVMSRDLKELFHDSVGLLHQSLGSPPLVWPKRVISLTNLAGNDKHKDKHAQFLKAVEDFVGVKSEKISLAGTWAKKPPAEAKGKGLQEYLDEAPFLSFCYEFYHQYDWFRKDYAAKFGKQPSTEATVQYRWDLGKSVTKQQYDEYQSRISVLHKWFDEKIMATGSAGDSPAVLVLPYASDAPQYDAPKPNNITGITGEILACTLQTPQVLAPFAQFPYQSKVSGQTEYHPIYGTVMGPKGSDTMLVKLVEATFNQAQWRTKVDTGRFAFPVAQNTRKVDDTPVKDAPATLQQAKVGMGEI